MVSFTLGESMKYLFSIMSFVLIWSSLLQASPASYVDYRDGNRYICQLDEEPQAKTCVTRCRVRSSSGECIQYNSDYCDSGSNISCVVSCRVRSSSGDCLQYNPDVCGNNVSCTTSCRVRSSSGECLRYNEDDCG